MTLTPLQVTFFSFVVFLRKKKLYNDSFHVLFFFALLNIGGKVTAAETPDEGVL